MMPVLNKIYQGDCLEIMKQWPDGFIQCVVTSPPYWGLRDYGVEGQLGLEKTLEEYIAKMVQVCREVKRVMRKDATLWLNMGDSYAASGKGGNPEGSQWNGFMGSRKRMESGMTTGTHGVKPPPGLKPKDLCGIPWRLAFALQADGWWLRSDIIWSKPNPMPESVTDRPTKAHEYIFLMTKSERYFYDQEAIKEPASEYIADGFRHNGPYTNNQSFDNSARNRKSLPETQAKLGTLRDKQRGHGRRHAGFNERWNEDRRDVHDNSKSMRNKRSVWTVSTHPFSEAHFATFPPDLISPCILAGSKEGDVILDPFMGAGTTALVTARLNRNFLGIELNPEYVKMTEKRIANEQAQIKMNLT